MAARGHAKYPGCGRERVASVAFARCGTAVASGRYSRWRRSSPSPRCCLPAPCRRQASPRRSRASPRPRQKPFITPQARPANCAAGRPIERPQPQRLHRPRGAEIALLRAPLLRPLGRPGPRRAEPQGPRRRRRARLRRAGAAGRRTRPPGRERRARLARAEERRPQGGRGRQDRHLPLADRRPAVRLRGARPRPEPKGHPLPRRLHGYLVLDNDYSAFEFPGTKPINDLEVTLAHEYNHILQFGYDAYQDPWFAESTAVWMEDQVYNDINDYLRYERRWVKLCETPLTASSIKEYGSAVWNEWLARRYGRPFIREDLGRGDPRPARRLLGRRLRRAIAPRSARASASTSASSPPRPPSGTPDQGFREADLYPDLPRQGTAAAERPAADPAPEPHHLPAAAGPRRRRQGRRSSTRSPRKATLPGSPWSAGSAASAAAAPSPASTSRRAAAGCGVACRDPGRFQPDHRRPRQRRRQRHGYSARRLDWRYLTDRIPFAISGRAVR